jgi:hypothetical protein
MPPALEILALDTATPQIRAPGSGDTYAAPRALAVTANPANTSLIAGSGYSLTGSDSTPMLDFSGTWNTTGTPTALRLNLTDTASNAASNLLDLQVGGSSRFRVTKSGAGVFAGGITAGGTSSTVSGNFTLLGSDGTTLNISSVVPVSISRGGNYGFIFSNNAPGGFGNIVFNNNAEAIRINPSNHLGIGTSNPTARLTVAAGTSPATAHIYNTFTAADNFERGKIEWASNVLQIGTEKGTVGGTARALELQTDGTTRLTIGTTGNATFSGNIISTTSRYYFASLTGAIWLSSGRIVLSNNSSLNDVGLVCFGNGGVATHPALKRDSAALQVRLADDSANAALESASVKTDAPAGGTSGTWKLGVAATVTPTSPNRTIEVDIGGTIYYIHAKTTND